MKKILAIAIISFLCFSTFPMFTPQVKATTVDISAQYSSFINASNNYKKIFGQDVAIGQTVDRTLSGIINDPPAHYSWHSWAGQTYPDPPDGFSIRVETIQLDYVYKIIGLGYMGGGQPSASGWIKVNSPFVIEQINNAFNYSWPDGSNVQLFVNKDTGDITFSAKWYNWPALVDATTFEFAITIAKPGGAVPPFSYDTTRGFASYAYDTDMRQVVVFGGRIWDAMSLQSDLWTFDPASSLWTSVTAVSGPSNRIVASMSYSPVARKLLVFGGCTDAGEASDTWTFQFTGANTGMWTQIAGTAPSPRSGAPMVFDSKNNLFVLFGGERYVYSLDETWVFNPSTNTWSNRNPSPSPSQRARAAMAYDAQSGKVLLFGGLNKGAGALLSDTWLYDAATNAWQQVSTATAPNARQWPSLASDDNGVFYLFGGWRVDAGGGLGQYLDDTWKFDMATMQWTQLLPSESPIAQSQGALMHIGSGKFVLMGGWRDSPLGEIWFYDGNQNIWSATPTRAFDPYTDGFNFTNFGFYYTTKEEINAEISNNPELSQLSDREREMLTEIAFFFSNGVNWAFETAGIGGHCYGMSATARYYFMNPEEPEPSKVCEMSFVQAAPKIREFQLTSYVSPYVLGKIFQLYFNNPIASQADNLAELSRIQDLIESEGVALVHLQNPFSETPEIWKCHSVLAYEVEEKPTGWRVWVYDSNSYDVYGQYILKSIDVNSDGSFSYASSPYSAFEFHQFGAIVSDATVFDYLLTFLRRIYAITVYSPANVLITDSLGRSIGTDLETGIAVNDIPGALYSGPNTEPQLVLIFDPIDGLYNIVLIGTATGDYTLTIEYIATDQTAIQTFQGTITPNEQQYYSAIISETGEMTVISWEHVFKDTKRGTMLKISTDDKYFQFTAPGKDFGVKYDPRMFVKRSIIIICYGDNEMRLAATAIDDDFDFCSAVAYDKQTRKTYLLVDKPNWRCQPN